MKAGASNCLLSSAPAFVQSIVLTSKSGAASLSIYAAATSSGLSPSTMNRLLVSVNPASGPRTIALDLGGVLWPTGLAVSCSGAVAVAVVNVSNRVRP